MEANSLDISECSLFPATVNSPDAKAPSIPAIFGRLPRQIPVDEVAK
jgi:hypothetical protein